MIRSNSDTTTTTSSPTPVSPFSSNYSVPSEATSEEVPDLGQFTAVLRAWTHLHSFPSRAINPHAYPGARQQQGLEPSLNSSSSRTGYLDSDQDQEQERAHSTVWAHRPIASYLASGDFTGTDTESHSQTDRERELGNPTMTATVHRVIPIPTTTLDDDEEPDADDEDFSDSRGGDAEGERPRSVQIEDLDDIDLSFGHEIYDDDNDDNTDADADATTATHDLHLDLDQMQLNSNEESQSQSEQSTDLGDVSLQEASEEQPSLGFLDEALRFIAAERERWNAQREAGLVSINGSVPLSSEPRRKRRRKRKTPRAHSVTRISTTSGNPSFTPGSSYTASASTPSLLSTIFQSANADADDADADADADDSSSSFDQQYTRRPIHGHQSLFKSTPSTPSRQRTRGGITKQLQPNRKSNANANPRLKHASSTPQLRPPSRIVAAPVVSEDNPRVGQLRSLGKKLEKLFPEDREFLRSVGYGPLSVQKSYFDGGGAGEDSGSGSGNGARSGSGGNGIFGNFVDTRGATPTTMIGGGGGGERLIHVFIDHSNILIGLLNYLKRHPRQHPQHGAGSGGDNHPSSSSYTYPYPKPPKHLSHSALTLILERGRPVSRRVLVTSSPLYQPMDSAELLGFEVRVFARVPDMGDGMDRENQNQRQQQRPGIGGHKRSVSSGSFTGVGGVGGGGGDVVTASPKKGGRRRAGSVNTNSNTNTGVSNTNTNTNGPPPAARKRGHQRGFSAGGGTSTESEQGQGTSTQQPFQLRNGIAAMLSPSTPGNGSNVSTPGGRIRYREQGVDELLQLKLHQALASIDGRPPKGSTIVLATGDGNAGQFNEDGFLGSVRTALKRGWKVELYAWEGGLSRAWKREFGEGSEWGARGGGGEGEGPKFKVIGMEQFGSELVEIYF
ncbi:hypothetical protein PM082_008268 [Marasmius tenuissimus]|nr:hypothetical protein PM082_008268 [Marasmius tenuissimus]